MAHAKKTQLPLLTQEEGRDFKKHFSRLVAAEHKKEHFSKIASTEVRERLIILFKQVIKIFTTNKKIFIKLSFRLYSATV
jgi:hypothetical protein